MKMISTALASLAAVAIAGAATSAAAADFCKAEFSPAGGGHFTGTMTVPQNSYCFITLNGSVVDPAITKKPRNGVAEYREMRVYYTPKKNFVGTDEFSFERSSLYSSGETKKRTYSIKLNVMAR